MAGIKLKEYSTTAIRRLTGKEACYTCTAVLLGLLVLSVVVLGLNNIKLMKAAEEEKIEISKLQHLDDKLSRELFFINYSLGSTFDPSHARDYIEYNNPEIKKLAFELNTPENMYYFVLKNISYVRVPKSVYAGEVLNLKEGDCDAKSNLLAALLRARGYPQERVKIAAGIAYLDREQNATIIHSWVEFFDYNKKKWFVLDTTPLLDIAYFEKYEKKDFYLKFVQDVFFEYNDGYYTISAPLTEEEVIENTQPQ